MIEEVIGQSETKMHLVLKALHPRASGRQPIEEVCALYAWTRTEDSWKMFAVWDVTVPY